MRKLYCQKEAVTVTKIDPAEMIKFYQMLLKIQKRRNSINVDRLMKSLYGNNFRDFLENNTIKNSESNSNSNSNL